MAAFFAEYGLFLAKAVTVLVVALLIAGGVFASASKGKKSTSGAIKIKKLNDELDKIKKEINHSILSKDALKQQEKNSKKQEKKDKKAEKKAEKNTKKINKKTDQEKPSEEGDRDQAKKRVYVLDFKGDVKASQVENLRHEITAVLMVANEHDEIVLRLESPGGMVHTYGLASSQLERIKRKNITLSICVDEIAASGGYMMACLGDKIYAAPFAIVGSVGVVAQLPNFNRLLKKNDIDYELFTAGEYKRTVTMMGENTEKGKEKFQQELDDTHVLFKEFVSSHRPQLDINAIATGEHWYGSRAKDKNLVDELMTSDEYLIEACKESEVFSVTYEKKKHVLDRIGIAAEGSIDRVLLKWFDRMQRQHLS